MTGAKSKTENLKTDTPKMPRKTTTSAKRGQPRVTDSSPWRPATLGKILLRLMQYLILATFLAIIAMRWMAPPTTMFMIIRHVERLWEHHSSPAILYAWTPMSTIPRHMALAVVASEDQLFPKHRGFDIGAIVQAMEYNKTHSKKRGASTISQQVAKNLFLWSGRSYARKGLEAALTVLIELCWSKKRILEVYLNTAEFGDGIYGVKAAAWRFYGKPPERLSPYEAATLAAVLPSPRKLSPQRPTPYLIYRARWIQNQMERLGSGFLEQR